MKKETYETNGRNIFLKSPSENWEKCFPVGNGYSGSMIYGGIESERINITEEKIWSGDKIDTSEEDFREKIDTLRSLLINNRPAEADRYANEHMKNSFHRIKSQETGGDIVIGFCYPNKAGGEDFSDYSRSLDLTSGVADISYRLGNIGYSRRIFSSYPDKVTVFSQRGAHSAVISFERENIKSISVKNNIMTVTASTAFGNHEFHVSVKAETDGQVSSENNKLKITNAFNTFLFIKISTECIPSFSDFESYGNYDIILERHIRDFSSLMNRSDIILHEKSEKQDLLTTDKKLARIKSDETLSDAGLVETYFRFGKYLLVSSSRPGTLPANLQGVWNGYIKAPWNSDYHTNINLQMNYWPAEGANLSECTLPLFDYMNNYLLESGKQTAEKNYRCRGTVVHHLSDIYGYTAPADGVWGLWPLGGAWLCYQMWEHYLYTLDKDFLRNTAYRYISECARFFLDYMFMHDGYLATGPSASPENRYYVNGESGETASLCLSPSMDIEIVGGLLKFYVEAENILKINPSQKYEAEKAIAKLPPLKIGKHGQVMEWQKDYGEPEPGHRHISHIFALYPDCAINEDTPELFEAAGKTLDRRLSHGGGHTGWSCAWLISLFARLKRPDDVFKNINKLLAHSTIDNLFDSHPPFQIDGNFGGCAAVMEMLLQSQNDKIVLLPALPKQFADGEFRGLMARGGIEVSAKWHDGKVTYAEFKAVYADVSREIHINGNKSVLSFKKRETFRYTC